MPKGSTYGFHCVYGLNKPKPMTNYIDGTSCGEIQGVDPPGYTYRRFPGGMTAGAPESNQILHVDLEYVWKCVGRCDSPNGARHSSPV